MGLALFSCNLLSSHATSPRPHLSVGGAKIKCSHCEPYPRGRMASKKAQKQELMRVLDAGVKEHREEISKKLEAFSLSTQALDSSCSSRSVQPGILIGS